MDAVVTKIILHLKKENFLLLVLLKIFRMIVVFERHMYFELIKKVKPGDQVLSAGS